MFRRLCLSLLIVAQCGAAQAGGMVFSGAADLGNNNGASSNLTASYAVGTGNNRILVACITTDNVTDSFTVTYNGVTMSGPVAGNSAGNPTIGGIVFYYLINPASSSHTLSATDNVQSTYIQILAADYSNANQAHQPDSSGIANDTGANDTFAGGFTTIQSGASVIGCANNDFGNATVPTVSGTFTRRTYGAQYGNTLLADHGPKVPAGNVTLTATIASGGVDMQGQSFLSLIPIPSGGSLMMTGVGN